MATQRGNCFEYSTVLCSFLIGAGYNAYVVSGYASLEFCTVDLTSQENPDLSSMLQEEETQTMKPRESKYKLKTPKEFISTYLAAMEDRALAANDEEKEIALKVAESILFHQLQKIPPDEFYGLRVHSWILVLPGMHGVEDPFFIEPSTGIPFSLNDPHYFGIESIWSDENYWINLQKCVEGCKDLKFDLKDPTCWTWLLLAEPWHMREPEDEAGFLNPAEGGDDEDKGDDEDEEDREPIPRKYFLEKHLDMPDSWVPPLKLPFKAYFTRYPNGEKQMKFKKSKAQYFAPYAQPDGLVRRLIVYDDYYWEKQINIYENFQYRSDFLVAVKQDLKEESVLETFIQGREDGLKEHFYYLACSSVEDPRRLEFFPNARYDGLWTLEMDPLFITVQYKDRHDRLYYRHAEFQKRVKGSSEDKRTVLSVVEKFERNPEVDADSDIAIRTFYPPERKVVIKYHYGENNIVAATREFTRPPPEELGDRLMFKPEETVGFNIKQDAVEPKQLQLFRNLIQQINAEDTALYNLREVEEELTSLLRQRLIESAVPKFLFSIYDTERNMQAIQELNEKKQQIKEIQDKEVESEVDYLAPYLARLDTPFLTVFEAHNLREECLTDFKNMMVRRANKIQEVFEAGAQELAAKGKWFEEEQDNLTQEEEDEYYEYSNNMAYQLHILQVRLNRHRQLAPERYLALEAWLRTDPRLAVLRQQSSEYLH